MRHRSSVEPVLGSRMTLVVEADGETSARAVEDAVLDEADRLEAILSLHRDESALRRWRRGELARPPREVVAVLALAQAWFGRTAGAFNPGLGAVVRRWQRAAREQQLPAREEVAALARAAHVLAFDVVGDDVVVTGDAGAVDVHAIAKGWIVDELVTTALAVDGVESVVVDIGGDLRHASTVDSLPVAVAVEDPFAVADNTRPLTVVEVAGRAVATSGGGRRGWTIGGQWYGHVLDPWTGWPLPHRSSATAVAPTAAAADAAASIALVLDGARLATLAENAGLAVLRASADGTTWRSAPWLATVAERSVDGDPDHRQREDRQRAGGHQGPAAPLALEQLDADTGDGDDEQEHR